ncbi:MAG: ABC-F family ATP-binding cassette domain-containing protein [Oscillospiraceae bacterium]|nr:ABC-F family ATP-binding cassette domain-containing protein [Oscillospiraceae bacterium]
MNIIKNYGKNLKMLIALENISKIWGGALVLNRAALTIEDGDRIGLIGANGCGKSTLLNIIAGRVHPEKLPEPDTERINRRKNAVIGFLEQNSGLERDCTVIEEVRGVFRELLVTAERLRELERLMSSSDLRGNEKEFAAIQEEYSSKSAYFEANDGYLIDVNISKILNGMSFPPDTYDRVISTLSGGEKTRLALAKLLLESPDLLILDEPTNHLDFNTVIWLEDFLRDYKGALLIVSHDRYFLDRLCNSICEIERGVLRRFKGNYTAFTIQKKALITRQLKEYEAQAAEMARLKEYVDKNIVRASTSNMAKSRQKKLEALEAEAVPKPVIHNRTSKIKFEYDRIPPLDILEVKNIDIAVGEGTERVTLAESLSFSIRRGEKLGVIGANGTGKSSLLKILQRVLPCSRGSIEWARNVKISYFDQEFARLNPKDTVMNAVHKLHPSMTENAVRSILGLVRISGENVFKRVGVISGGEKVKLCFALMMLERGNVLLLDEPTNHLDIDTKEVLEQALYEYDGTIIFVSHDRYLLNRLASRILEIAESAVESYSGGFDDYMNIRRERLAEAEKDKFSEKVPEESSKPAAPSNPPCRSKEQRANNAKKRLRIKELEAAIYDAEEKMAALQSEMSTPEVCADYILMQEKCALYEELKQQASDYTDEWAEISD